MGLLEKIKGTFSSGSDHEVILTATFATRPDTVYAPISGMLVTLKEVNDETVSKGLLGEGCGILPMGGTVLRSPVNGRVAATTVTNHSIGLLGEGGQQIIMHIGIDTVKMEGKGFHRFVENNDEVKAGQPLIEFDPQAIHDGGYDDVVIVTVTNPHDFWRVTHVGASATLLGDRPLVKIGDPLLVTRDMREQ